MLVDKEEKEAPVKPKRSKKRLLIISGIVLILAAAGASYWYFRQSASNVKTQIVKKQTLKEIIDVSGSVESEQDITLKSASSGIVINRFINENVRISEGSPLLTIDPQQSQLQLNQARVNSITSRAQAQTELENSKKSLADAISRQRSNMESLNSQISKAQSGVFFLQKEISRNEKLLKEGAITRQTVDNQKQQLEQARLDLQTASDNLKKMKNEKGEIVLAQNRISQAETAFQNSVRQSEAAISIASDVVKKTTINAPFSGTMTKWLVNPGDFVTPGTPLGKFQDLNDIRLNLPLNELDLPKISTKNPVEIVFDAYPDKTFKGKITWISQSSVLDNENVQTFPVEVSFANPKQLIKPGMSADAQITVSEKENVLAIPLVSINKKEDKIFVKILDDNKVKEVEIKPGISTLDFLEVRSGLNPGDLLVIEEEKKK
jgi:HlyD family secretion protein